MKYKWVAPYTKSKVYVDGLGDLLLLHYGDSLTLKFNHTPSYDETREGLLTPMPFTYRGIEYAVDIHLKLSAKGWVLGYDNTMQRISWRKTASKTVKEKVLESVTKWAKEHGHEGVSDALERIRMHDLHIIEEDLIKAREAVADYEQAMAKLENGGVLNRSPYLWELEKNK